MDFAMAQTLFYLFWYCITFTAFNMSLVMGFTITNVGHSLKKDAIIVMIFIQWLYMIFSQLLLVAFFMLIWGFAK